MKRNETKKPNEKRDVRLQEEIDDSRNTGIGPALAQTCPRPAPTCPNAALLPCPALRCPAMLFQHCHCRRKQIVFFDL